MYLNDEKFLPFHFNFMGDLKKKKIKEERKIQRKILQEFHFTHVVLKLIYKWKRVSHVWEVFFFSQFLSTCHIANFSELRVSKVPQLAFYTQKSVFLASVSNFCFSSSSVVFIFIFLGTNLLKAARGFQRVDIMWEFRRGPVTSYKGWISRAEGGE